MYLKDSPTWWSIDSLRLHTIAGGMMKYENEWAANCKVCKSEWGILRIPEYFYVNMKYVISTFMLLSRGWIWVCSNLFLYFMSAFRLFTDDFMENDTAELMSYRACKLQCCVLMRWGFDWKYWMFYFLVFSLSCSGYVLNYANIFSFQEILIICVEF